MTENRSSRQRMRKCRIEGTDNTLLARRLKAANPDASHPGKAEEKSQG